MGVGKIASQCARKCIIMWNYPNYSDDIMDIIVLLHIIFAISHVSGVLYYFHAIDSCQTTYRGSGGHQLSFNLQKYEETNVLYACFRYCFSLFHKIHNNDLCFLQYG